MLARPLQESCEALKRERDVMYQELQTISYLQAYPSHANFILCSVVGRDAGRLKDALAHRYGIMVRHYAKKELSGFIRVSAGKPEHTRALLQALRDLEEQDLPEQAAEGGALAGQLESEAQPAGTFAGS